MGKSWLKNESAHKGFNGVLADNQAAAGFANGLQTMKRRFRARWYRHVKMPFYALVARGWPESRIGRKYLPEKRREENHQKVAAVVGPPTKGYDLMLFSIIDWRFRIQRPQQLCRQFARMGYRVFYVQTTIHSTPGGSVWRAVIASWIRRSRTFSSARLHCELPRPGGLSHPDGAGHRVRIQAQHRTSAARPSNPVAGLGGGESFLASAGRSPSRHPAGL